MASLHTMPPHVKVKGQHIAYGAHSTDRESWCVVAVERVPGIAMCHAPTRQGQRSVYYADKLQCSRCAVLRSL